MGQNLGAVGLNWSALTCGGCVVLKVGNGAVNSLSRNSAWAARTSVTDCKEGERSIVAFVARQ